MDELSSVSLGHWEETRLQKNLGKTLPNYICSTVVKKPPNHEMRRLVLGNKRGKKSHRTYQIKHLYSSVCNWRLRCSKNMTYKQPFASLASLTTTQLFKNSIRTNTIWVRAKSSIYMRETRRCVLDSPFQVNISRDCMCLHTGPTSSYWSCVFLKHSSKSVIWSGCPKLNPKFFWKCWEVPKKPKKPKVETT